MGSDTSPTAINRSSPDIFISYTMQDHEVAEAIKAYLEQRSFRYWKAPEDVSAGEGWPESISRARKAGRVMILLWNAASMASHEVFCELCLASQQRLAIVPYRLKPVEPREGWDYQLVATQWLDAFPPPAHKYFEKAAERIKVIVRGPSDPQTNNAAYQLSVVLGASSCPTFQGAKLILDRIDANRICDNELTSLVAYCRELVNFCIEVGIPRDTEPHMNDPLKMCRAIDKWQLCHAFFTRGPFYNLATALRLRKLNPQFASRVLRIAKRYRLALV